MTHQPEFVAEMKAALEEEKTKLEKDVNATNDFPEYGRNDEDNVTEMADYQASSSTEDNLRERLTNIEAALTRIEAGTYGVTKEGETIPEERLRANPAAEDVVK